MESAGRARAGAAGALPALVVHGELDRIAPVAASHALAAGLPDAELHVLPGIGHVPVMTAPAQVAGLIRQRFFAAHSAEAVA